MTTSARRSRPATIEEWLAAPAERRLELIAGELVEKAAPDFVHADSQFGLSDILRPEFSRRGGGGHPGGWWIGGEIDILLGEDGFRPDLVGWRRERAPTMPRERPVALRPDWICEVVSESNAATDTVKKLRRYHRASVPHYWLIDPSQKTLTVLRHSPEGYLTVLAAEGRETVRAEPFDAIEIRLGLLFGEDRDDPAAGGP